MGKKDFRMYSNLLILSQVGIMMIVPIVAGVFIGNWLDTKLHTSPLFLFLGIVIFTISGFMNLYKFTMAQAERDQKRSKAGGGTGMSGFVPPRSNSPRPPKENSKKKED